MERVGDSTDLLGAEMESWADFLAIEVVYQNALLLDVPERPRFQVLLRVTQDAVVRFDAALQTNMVYLKPIV